MAKKTRRKKTVESCESIDRGTLETRRRLTADPLSDASLDPHRAFAGLQIRTALEEGVGAKGLDMVRIGMSAGASHSYDQPLPLERLLIAREWLARWRSACTRSGLHPVFAEQFCVGNSIRQIAQHHVLSRRRVTTFVHDALDLYAEMRGFKPKPRAAIRVSETTESSAVQPDVEAAAWKLPETARLKRRNLA